MNTSWGSFYNFAQKYLGTSWAIGGSGTSWIRTNLGLELSSDYQETHAPDGMLDGKHFRISMRNTWLLSKDLFVRLYLQGRWSTTYYSQKKIENKYLTSFLLGWEFRPGSWFYLAYNEGREDFYDTYNPSNWERDFFVTDRTLIGKVQCAFNK